MVCDELNDEFEGRLMVNLVGSSTSRSYSLSEEQLPLGRATKRGVDVCMALTGLVALVPLLLMCALAVYITSGRGILYRHRRIGLNGVEFDCLKFRTMARNSDTLLHAYLETHPEAREEWESTRKLRADPRVTAFGRVLRKTSVDELPQLFNVLRGDMSIVGPRPIVAKELEKYGLYKKAYLQCRPGITGLWQTSGRSNTTYRRRVACDAYYLKNWSFALDARIIARTLPVLLGSDNAC